jgi:hypothetical protein
VAGLYRFSSFGLCCGEYGTIYFECWPGVGGGAVQVSSGIICRSCVL